MSVKQFRSYDEQISQLELRGLIVDDKVAFRHYLEYGNYYRLSAYWLPFRINQNGIRLDKFYQGTTSSQILSIFDFDNELRKTCFGLLSRIEIAFRAIFGHEIGHVDPMAYLDIRKLDNTPTPNRMNRHKLWLKRYDKNLENANTTFFLNKFTNCQH